MSRIAGCVDDGVTGGGGDSGGEDGVDDIVVGGLDDIMVDVFRLIHRGLTR